GCPFGYIYYLAVPISVRELLNWSANVKTRIELAKPCIGPLALFGKLTTCGLSLPLLFSSLAFHASIQPCLSLYIFHSRLCYWASLLAEPHLFSVIMMRWKIICNTYTTASLYIPALLLLSF